VSGPTLNIATPSDLWLTVYQRLGVKLPWKVFTPGHSSPLAFLADALAHPGDDVAAWACRSGGKTLTASILAALEFATTDGLQARVLSGSEDQARFLYEYWCRWCGRLLGPRVSGEVKRQLTRVAGGRLEILAASQKKVRGGKVQRLYEDELDEIDPDIDAAAVGMIASRGRLAGRTVYTSTYHRVDGLMGRLVAEADRRGVRLHRWNVWEAIARCPPDRHAHGRGCDACPLEPACRGKARALRGRDDWPVGIAARAAGLYAVDDVIKAYRKVARSIWESEYECRRPTPRGLVYPEFDPADHVVDAAPAGLDVYRSIDWGYGAFVCLWLGVDAAGRVTVLDTYKAGDAPLADHARAVLDRSPADVVATFCDPAGRNRNDQTGRSNVEQFGRLGIPCRYTLAPAAREVANGIRLIRSLLRPAGGPPRLTVVATEGNRALIADFASYRNRQVNGLYVDEPVKPQPADHTMDALRYFAVNHLLPRRGGAVALTAR
jgi:hypothetical protein